MFLSCYKALPLGYSQAGDKAGVVVVVSIAP